MTSFALLPTCTCHGPSDDLQQNATFACCILDEANRSIASSQAGDADTAKVDIAMAHPCQHCEHVCSGLSWCEGAVGEAACHPQHAGASSREMYRAAGKYLVTARVPLSHHWQVSQIAMCL